MTAKSKKAKTYEGAPCKRYGHTTRYVSSKACVACASILAKENPRPSTEEHKQKCREYYQKNKEHLKAKANKRYSQNREAILEIVRRYREENPEAVLRSQRKYSRKYREEINERGRKWRRANRDKCNYYSSRNRKEVRKATPSWLTEWDLFVIQEHYYKARRLYQLTGIEWHVDHIYPLMGNKARGLHVPWNLRVIPASENLKKSNKMPEEFYE